MAIMSATGLTLLHSEWPKLHRVLAILSAIGLNATSCTAVIHGKTLWHYVIFFKKFTCNK